MPGDIRNFKKIFTINRQHALTYQDLCVRKSTLTGCHQQCLTTMRSAVQDRAGSVLVLTALTIPVLLLLIGFAADFGFASYLNQRLARAADTAVLSAVSQSAATAVGGYGNTAWLQTYGNSIFAENIKQLPIKNVNATVSVVSDGNGGVIATASYNYSVKALFGGVTGISLFPVSGSVQAVAKPLTYVNYYILVDGSQSMGIATTQTDMINLYNRVIAYNNGSGGESGCVFGCHVKAPGQSYTNEYLAHSISPAITLRIDSAVQAIQNIINTAASTVGSTKNIKFGIYVIQADPSSGTYLKTIQSPTSDYTAANTAAGTITLGNNISAGRGDTDYVNELSAFNAILPAAGSGASAASPQNFVFLITDGVTDTYVPACTSGHCTGTLDSTKCTALKNKATVGVIYTTYMPIQNNPNNPTGYEGNYVNLVQPFSTQIAPALQACATSSDYYFEANYGSEIVNAMRALFNKSLPTSARLQQ